jgi:hypothetical protein
MVPNAQPPAASRGFNGFGRNGLPPDASVYADMREQASSLLQNAYFDQSITADFLTKLSLPASDRTSRTIQRHLIYRSHHR